MNLSAEHIVPPGLSPTHLGVDALADACGRLAWACAQLGLDVQSAAWVSMLPTSPALRADDRVTAPAGLETWPADVARADALRQVCDAAEYLATRCSTIADAPEQRLAAEVVGELRAMLRSLHRDG